MKSIKQDLWQKNGGSYLTALASALLTLALWWAYQPYLPENLPLFYSLAWGESQLASLTQLMILPSITALVVLINFIISWHLHQSQLVVKRVLAISAVLISTLLLITTLKIIYTFI